MVKRERRKHRRATLELPLDVKDMASGGKSLQARTVNLSAGGFYCKVPNYIPVMTKLGVSLVIPVTDSAGRPEDHVINCEAMVVRILPEKEDPAAKTYEIGCFLTDIDDYDRLVIEHYLAEKATP
jgi:hypothetical protein